MDPQCSICGFPSAKIEITKGIAIQIMRLCNWRKHRSYNKYRDFDADYLIYSIPRGQNREIGNPFSIKKEKAIIKAFTAPYDLEEIQNQFYDMARFCLECN